MKVVNGRVTPSVTLGEPTLHMHFTLVTGSRVTLGVGLPFWLVTPGVEATFSPV